MHSRPLPAQKGTFRFSGDRERPSAAFPMGLGANGMHEVCGAGHADFAALTGFALAARAARTGVTLWIRQTNLTQEHGRLFQEGPGCLNHAPQNILNVTVRKLPDALWAVEEVVRSAAAGLVIAELTDADFTASRRLALASGRHGVPVILLMPHTREGATAASARWRVSPRPSAPNRHDPHAPGALRWKALLERSRQAPHLAGQTFDLELDDETLSLRVVSGLAADPAPARGARAEDRIGAASPRKTA